MVSVIIATWVGMQIRWGVLMYVSAIPLGIGFFCSYFQVQYLIGIFITLAASYFLLIYLKVITKEDLQDSLAVLPHTPANKLMSAYRIIRRKIK